MAGDVLLACAASLEGERVVARAPAAAVVTGVGKAAMAAVLTDRILALRPCAVLLFGVAGAYPARHRAGGTGLQVLDLCVVVADRFADEGVLTPDGFRGLADLGLGNEGPFPADRALCASLADALDAPAEVQGCTVSTCSGTEDASRTLAQRSGADVESMEGAAAALACARLGVPFAQLRCISNFTGDRTQGAFDIHSAVARVQDAVLHWLERGGAGS